MTAIHVLRSKSAVDGTVGVLTLANNYWKCDTLELGWYNNETGRSCVIADTYNCWLWFSPHMNRQVLRLQDKHGRKDCLVHPATWAGDSGSGEFTQLHGCTATGRGFALLQRPDGKEQFGITNSRITFEEFLRQIGPGPHTIQYEWAEGCAPDDLSDHQQQ